MGLLKSESVICPIDQKCSQWARKYMGYCICSTRDEFSLALGLISVMSWCLAEVPQIITNYKKKSADGLSLTFLLTWTIGDLFNLFGCILEPATLPTQYYMAVLYTVTTSTLAAQAIYYGHIYPRLKSNKGRHETELKVGKKVRLISLGHETTPTVRHAPPGLMGLAAQLIGTLVGAALMSLSHLVQGTVLPQVHENKIAPYLTAIAFGLVASQGTVEEQKSEYSHGVIVKEVNNVEKCRITPSSPIPLPKSSQSSSPEDEWYLMSARSLSVSHTPIAGSFPSQRTPTSDAEQQGLKEPLLGEVKPMPSESSPKAKNLLCVVFLVTFFLGSLNQNLLGIHEKKLKSPTGGMVFHIRRQLLKAKDISVSTQGTVAAGSNGIGSYLGWGMTAIYLGGRLPQICLNIRRGSAEGLNPLMFVFALLGNSTYVASILVKSLDWLKVRPNLPWLVDAAGCMLLDIFILIQFIYFRYRSRSEGEKYRD